MVKKLFAKDITSKYGSLGKMMYAGELGKIANQGREKVAVFKAFQEALAQSHPGDTTEVLARALGKISRHPLFSQQEVIAIKDYLRKEGFFVPSRLIYDARERANENMGGREEKENSPLSGRFPAPGKEINSRKNLASVFSNREEFNKIRTMPRSGKTDYSKISPQLSAPGALSGINPRK
jgi:hypothetical protein